MLLKCGWDKHRIAASLIGLLVVCVGFHKGLWRGHPPSRCDSFGAVAYWQQNILVIVKKRPRQMFLDLFCSWNSPYCWTWVWGSMETPSKLGKWYGFVGLLCVPGELPTVNGRYWWIPILAVDLGKVQQREMNMIYDDGRFLKRQEWYLFFVWWSTFLCKLEFHKILEIGGSGSLMLNPLTLKMIWGQKCFPWF